MSSMKKEECSALCFRCDEEPKSGRVFGEISTGALMVRARMKLSSHHILVTIDV